MEKQQFKQNMLTSNKKEEKPRPTELKVGKRDMPKKDSLANVNSPALSKQMNSNPSQPKQPDKMPQAVKKDKPVADPKVQQSGQKPPKKVEKALE